MVRERDRDKKGERGGYIGKARCIDIRIKREREREGDRVIDRELGSYIIQPTRPVED